jgi:hypothetical protein
VMTFPRGLAHRWKPFLAGRLQGPEVERHKSSSFNSAIFIRDLSSPILRGWLP